MILLLFFMAKRTNFLVMKYVPGYTKIFFLIFKLLQELQPPLLQHRQKQVKIKTFVEPQIPTIRFRNATDIYTSELKKMADSTLNFGPIK